MATKKKLFPFMQFQLQKMPLFRLLFFFLSYLFTKFFFAVFFSRVLRDSTPRYVGRSVGRSIGRSPFYFFGAFELFEHTAPAQMPLRPSPALLLPTRTRLG